MKPPLTLTIRPTHALLNSNSRLSPHSIPADISHFVRAYPFERNDETVKKKGRRDINSGRATIRKFTWSLHKTSRLCVRLQLVSGEREREQQPSGDIEQQQQQQPNSRWNHQPWPSWWWWWPITTIFIWFFFFLGSFSPVPSGCWAVERIGNTTSESFKGNTLTGIIKKKKLNSVR